MAGPAGELDRRRVQLNSLPYLEAHELSNGMLATTGFCCSSGTTEQPINPMSPAAAELSWQRTAAFFKKNVV